MNATRLLVTSVLTAVTLMSATVEATDIAFSGYNWTICPSGRGGPGPNNWDPTNVFVDANGYLHLKITQNKSKWSCAEVYTTVSPNTNTGRLGFGRYQFQTGSRIDTLDPNVVLGLFNYPTSDVGPDGTNEIDIEYARWGNASWPNGNFTVWPTTTTLSRTTQSFFFGLQGNDSTHRFDWNSTSIRFQTFNGLVPITDIATQPIVNWSYAPSDPANRISTKPMPVHLNLWLFNGQAPKNKTPVEIIIKSFNYTP